MQQIQYNKIRYNMNNKYTVALVDFRLTGHHPYYLASFANQFSTLGCNVDIFVSNEVECREKLKNALPSLKLDNIAIHEIESANMWKRTYGCRSYFRLKELDREISVIEQKYDKTFDLIFFPYIDDLVQQELIIPYLIKPPFHRYFSGLLMEPRLKLLKKPRFPLNLITSTWLELPGTNYQELGILVEDVTNQVKSLLEKNIIHYPDFCSTDTTEQPDDPICSQIRSSINNRVVTSLLGSILPHKSLDLFLECIEAANPDEHLFVIAGRISKDKFSERSLKNLEPLFSTPRENVLIFDQWIPSEAVFDTIVKYSDVLFAHYRNFPKSSNILSKAAYHRKPVIVSNQFLLGKRVSTYNLGFSLSEHEIPALYKTNTIRSWSVDENARQDFISLHSESRLQTIFEDLVA